MKYLIAPVLLLAMSMTLSCKKSGSTPVPTLYIKALINGTSFSADEVSTQVFSSDFVSIYGSAPNPGRSTINLSFTHYDPAHSVGRYPIGATGAPAKALYLHDSVHTTAVSGYIDIISRSGGIIQGQFNFTTDDSTKVMNGSFSAKESM